MSQAPSAPPTVNETEFEKRRGIRRVEVRPGYAQAHVRGIGGAVGEGCLGALEALDKAAISIDFLKFTPGGISFLIREDHADAVERALAPLGHDVCVQGGRHVVMVHAVNVRDEEGLLASIMLHAIESGASVGHVSDMHDRALMVVDQADAERLKARLERGLAGTRP